MQNTTAISSWQMAVSNAVVDTLSTLLGFLPNLLGAIIVLIIGLIIARWSKTVIVKALQAIKFESYVKDTRLKKFLQKADITHKIEELIGSIFKWIIAITFFIASANIMGLSAISRLLGGILEYVPNVLSAVIVLALGVLLAGVMEGVVKGALATVDLKTSRLMGKIASYIVITIAVLAALSELHIAQNFINILFIGVVTSLALGIGLAVGLGSKDLVSRLLTDWYNSLSKELKKK